MNSKVRNLLAEFYPGGAAPIWRGVEAALPDGRPVSVVDTVPARYEASVVAAGVTGQVPAATRYLSRVMAERDPDRRRRLLAGDILVVKGADGTRMVVHESDLAHVDHPFMGSRAAVLGGRPTVTPKRGETSPRGVKLARHEKAAVTAALVSGRLGLGPMNRRAAKLFAATFGIKHVALTCNGSVPLTLAVKLLGIGEGDDILTGGLTFAATAGAMYDARVNPIEVDCLPGNLTIDAATVRAYLEACVREGRRLPKAVIAVALYWQIPDMGALRAICDEYGIKLVLDFAHGPYAEIDGLPATRFADVVTYSFQQSKSLALGEGGAIAVNDDELAPGMPMLVSCGYMPWDHLTEAIQNGLELAEGTDGRFMLPSAFNQRQSINYRMPEVQAAQLWARLATIMDVFETAMANIPRVQAVVKRNSDILMAYDDVPNARGPFYKYGYRVRPEWMPADVHRWAMRAQSGYEVIFCYPALTMADQRNPLMPRALEGLVNPEYLALITEPHKVPNAEGAIDVAALFEWRYLVDGDPAAALDEELAVLRRDRDLILARA